MWAKMPGISAGPWERCWACGSWAESGSGRAYCNDGWMFSLFRKKLLTKSPAVVIIFWQLRECWNGRQARLRCVWLRRGGSSPLSRTKKLGCPLGHPSFLIVGSTNNEMEMSGVICSAEARRRRHHSVTSPLSRIPGVSPVGEFRYRKVLVCLAFLFNGKRLLPQKMGIWW